ncbi:MAG: MoaD/ThiS family protein [Actinomycetota bacterium]
MPRLRLFASLREAAGRERDEFAAATLPELLEQARRRYGDDFGHVLERSTVAVNGEPAGTALDPHDTPLADDDEVALLPPVSGGAGGRPLRWITRSWREPQATS